MAQVPSVGIMEAYIRQAAAARGIDPDVAVKVAKSEGLAPDTWQATGNLSYGRERSYGPFQLHVAPKGHQPGLGNEFIRKTGLDPSDPGTWKQGIDFALDRASKAGWGDWFGAKRVGITGKFGVGPAPATPLEPKYPSTFPARPEGIIPRVEDQFRMSGMDPMPTPKTVRPMVTPPLNPMRVGPKPFNTAGPQPGLSSPLASPAGAAGGAGMGGILSALGMMMGGMGGDEPAPQPAPMPNISVPRTDPVLPKHDYTAAPEEDKVKKLMEMLGVR